MAIRFLTRHARPGWPSTILETPDMHSIRVGLATNTRGSRTLRLFVVAAAIAAFTALAPAAFAGSHHGFHLDKTCAEAPSEPLGYVCTVQHSDFKWIPAGTDVHYLSQTGNVVDAMIGIRNGSTSGACVWSSDVDAVCTFSSGTGRLTEFHLVVVVTANADQSIWYWDGSYWFGG
jgi:hypothetical protein